MNRAGNCYEYVVSGLMAGSTYFLASLVFLFRTLIFGIAFSGLASSFSSFSSSYPSLFLVAEATDFTEEAPGWVENLDASGTSKMQGPVCRGSFIWQEATDKSTTGKIRILADKAERSEGFLEFSGGVQMLVGNITINSDNALYEEKLKRVRLSGSVELSSPQIIARGFDATYQKTDSADKGSEQNSDYSIELTQGVFSQPDSNIHGIGSSVTYKDSVIIIKDAEVSFCDPYEDTWHISGREIRLNLATMQGLARGAKFNVGNRPILYLGYVPFPLGEKRQSGFLAPNFNYNSHNGFTYSQPVYLNIAANYDSTLYPQFLQKQGFLWEQDFRWLTAAGTGSLGIGYIHKDAVFGDARGAQYFKFSSVVSNGWSGEIDWAAISDKNYFRDLPSVIPSSGDFALPRSAHIRYANKWVDWIFGLRDYQFIALNEEDFIAPYINLPYARLSLYTNSATSGLYLKNSVDYSSFKLDQDNNIITITNDGTLGEVEILSGENSRLHNELTLGWQAPFRWGQIHSRLNWQLLDYQINEELLNRHNIKNNGAISRNYYYFDTDASLVFSRPIKNALCDCYLTFEPRIYGLTSRQDASASATDLSARFAQRGFFDTTPGRIDYDYLFTQRRFRGLDRYVGEERFSVGLESRLLDLQGKGVYAFRVGSIVSESIKPINSPSEYFTNTTNPWAMDLSFNFGQRNFFRLDVAGASDELDSYGLTFSHANNKKSGVSIIYRNQEREFYQEQGHQLANNFAWYIVPRWSLVGGWRYNLSTNKLTNSVAGFGYENCCFKGLAGFFNKPNGNRQDSGVTLQFSFTPLGSIGSNSNTGFATLNSGRIEDIYSEFR